MNREQIISDAIRWACDTVSCEAALSDEYLNKLRNGGLNDNEIIRLLAMDFLDEAHNYLEDLDEFGENEDGE